MQRDTVKSGSLMLLTLAGIVALAIPACVDMEDLSNDVRDDSACTDKGVYCAPEASCVAFGTSSECVCPPGTYGDGRVGEGYFGCDAINGGTSSGGETSSNSGVATDTETDTSASSSDAIDDADNDGLSDRMERREGTNPNNPDSDNDGLLDGAEVTLGTSPLDVDSDGDGLGDGMEVNTTHTNPLMADSDLDADEILYDKDNCPRDFNPFQLDDDADGIGNACEMPDVPEVTPVGSTPTAAPVLAWSDESESGAVAYQVEVATDAAFASAVALEVRTTSVPLKTVKSDAAPGLWRWRVRAIHASEYASAWSGVDTFTLAP